MSDTSFQLKKRMSVLETVIEAYPFARLVDESNISGASTFAVYTEENRGSAECLARAPHPNIAWSRARRLLADRFNMPIFTAS